MIRSTLLAAQGGFEPPSVVEFQSRCWGPSAGKVFGYEACFNRVSFLMLLTALMVMLAFFFAFRRARLVPGRWQSAMEVGVDFIRNDVVLQVIGPKGLRFLPYLLSVFFFIFMGNLMGVLPPFLFPVNSRVAVPAFLAIVTWGVFNWVGIKEQGLGRYVRNALAPPGMPWWVYPLVTPIEFVSTFLVRPFTLTVRLMANMIAGHLVLAVFFLGTAYLVQSPVTALFGIGSFLAGLAFVLFELLVAVLQAYIFTILTAVYISGAIEPEH